MVDRSESKETGVWQCSAVLEGHLGAVYDLSSGDPDTLWSVGGDGCLVRWTRRDGAWNPQGMAMAKADEALFCVSGCCRMERCWPEAHPAGSLHGRTQGWKSSAGMPAEPLWSRTNGVPERTVIFDVGGPENPWGRFPAGSAACWTPGGGPASAFTTAMRPGWGRRRHNPCTTEVSAR